MSIVRRFQVGTVLLLLLLAGLLLPGSAARAEVYAYSSDLIVDLKFGGATVFGHQRSSTDNLAHYQGAGLDDKSDPLDALQAKSAGGGFPPENHFGQWQDTGNYARADSMISGTSIQGMGGANVAEGARSRTGEIIAFADVSFAFGLRQTSAAPIDISFTATPVMFAFARRSQESAVASIEFSIVLRRHGKVDPILTWKPNGTPLGDFTFSEGVVTGVADPFSLNKVVVASGPGFDGYVPGTGQFALSYALGEGQEFDVEVKWAEKLRAIAAVPEPSSTVLMVLGLAAMTGLGVARRRRA